jgi:hypothetical protein
LLSFIDGCVWGVAPLGTKVTLLRYCCCIWGSGLLGLHPLVIYSSSESAEEDSSAKERWVIMMGEAVLVHLYCMWMTMCSNLQKWRNILAMTLGGQKS